MAKSLQSLVPLPSCTSETPSLVFMTLPMFLISPHSPPRVSPMPSCLLLCFPLSWDIILSSELKDHQSTDSCLQPHIFSNVYVLVHLTASQGMIADQEEDRRAWGQTSGQGSRQESTTIIQARGDVARLRTSGLPETFVWAPVLLLTELELCFWTWVWDFTFILKNLAIVGLTQYCSLSFILLISLYPLIWHSSYPDSCHSAIWSMYYFYTTQVMDNIDGKGLGRKNTVKTVTCFSHQMAACPRNWCNAAFKWNWNLSIVGFYRVWNWGGVVAESMVGAWNESMAHWETACGCNISQQGLGGWQRRVKAGSTLWIILRYNEEA